jgi:hypothetical protein
MVYFIQGNKTRLVKIGQTTNLTKRLRALQAHSPDQLYVLATIPDEKADAPYHLRFRESWAGHGEWFNPSPELMAFIKTLTPSALTACTVSNYTVKATVCPQLPPQILLEPPQVAREWIAEQALKGIRGSRPGSSTHLGFIKQYARLRGWKSWRDVPVPVESVTLAPSENRYAN